MQADDHIPASEAEERFRGLVTALRLWAPGAIALCAPGWRRSGEGRWGAVGVGGPGTTRGEPWTLAADEEDDLREFLTALGDTPAGGPVGWALGRFEMGCERAHDAEALSDYLLGLRALLDATSDAGEASLALRVAALCARGGRAAGGAAPDRGGARRSSASSWAAAAAFRSGSARSPRATSCARWRAHLRALLRDVLCGYLEPDLKGVADDILLETAPEPFALAEERHAPVEVEVRDLREEPEPETDQSSSRSASAPVQHELEGVTQSADWGWDDPEDFSAPGLNR